MLPAERYENVKTYMQQNKYANINELATEFDTSTPTIRRCLRQLEADKVVKIVRGGAIYTEATVVEQPYNIKKMQNIEEKARIANEASKYIASNKSIFLDSSSTVYELIDHISGFQNLTVTTNDVKIAEALSAVPDVSVLVTGGILRKKYYTLTGSFAENLMQQVHIDCAFLGVDAITVDGHFMITNMEESGIKRAIFNNATKRIVLCDHTKFGNNAFINLWNPEQVDMIITGTELNEDLFDCYRELGFNIVRV